MAEPVTLADHIRDRGTERDAVRIAAERVAQLEAALIGALIANPRAGVAKLAPGFSSDHYNDPLYKSVHDVIVAEGNGEPLFLKQALAIEGEDFEHLVACVTGMVGMVGITTYSAAITEAFHRRQCIAIAESMLDDLRKGHLEFPATAVINSAVMRLDAVAGGTHNYGAGSSLDKALDSALEATTRAHHGELILGRSTGMPTVDEVIGGLENGTFNVLAARPGMGKTALACQWAVHIARGCKTAGEGGVLGFSLEMSRTALARRILSEASRVSVVDLKRGRIDGRIEQISRARRELAGLPVWIEDAGGQNLVAIRQKCRGAQRRYGKLALIWVDHIQIVKPDDIDRRNGATQAVGRVSNTLRDLSKEFDCPVLCLSQLSRNLLSRDDKRPNMGDLRQSGDIEQDADTVMFVHREEALLSKSEPEPIQSETDKKYEARVDAWRQARERCRGKADLIFEKVRDGEPKTIQLRFDGPTTSFSEPPKTQHHSAGTPSLMEFHDRFEANDPWAGESILP
jgi:replicative DNA helicase